MRTWCIGFVIMSLAIGTLAIGAMFPIIPLVVVCAALLWVVPMVLGKLYRGEL